MPASLTGDQMKDVGLKRFKKTNLYYATDPYLLYQDPTWLGFKLFFLFDQPDSRLLYKGGDVDKETEGTQLFDNTAYKYLKLIGEERRAQYLSQFVTHLQNINNITPWYFQTIEGLGDAWKRGYQEDEFKSALPKDRKIVINCLESIDLRMSALMDLYRKACFDWKYRREIVPWNLRTFSVYIYVYELRNINRTGKPGPSGLIDIQKELGLPDVNEKQQKENKDLLGLDPYDDGSPYQSIASRASQAAKDFKADPIGGIKKAFNPSALGNEPSNTPNPYINRFLFRFSFCEFLPDESSVVLDKTSSVVGAEGEAAIQKLAFTYRDVEELNLYNLWSDKQVADAVLATLDQSALDNPSLNKLAESNKPGGFDMQSVLNDKFGKLGGAITGGLASLAAEKLERLLASYAGKLLLGNIYGFSAANAAGSVGGILTGDPTQVAQGLGQLGGSLLGSKSKKNDTNDLTGLGKVFDRSASIANDFISVLKSEVPSSTGQESMANKKISEVSNVVLPSDGKISLANEDKSINPGNNFTDPSNSLSNNSKEASGNNFPDPSNSLSNNSKEASGNNFPDPSASISNNTKDASGNVYSPGVSINNNSKPASGNVYEG
jgi:hypothetical protein